MSERFQALAEKARKLPLLPGVYLMKNKQGKIIYVGKAKALKNRVSQYFGSQTRHGEKVRMMVYNVDDFNYIVCDSEFEALMLECSLIKLHSPKYNILLKDDKGYHYVKITKPPWSRIQACKLVEKDGAKYLGPYNSGFIVTRTVDEALRVFKLPGCSRVFPRDIGKERPCLNYYIGQCMAPCSGRIGQEDYDGIVKEAVDFIKGGATSSVEHMTRMMAAAAENLEFEKAARMRDRIHAIQKINQKQKVVETRIKEQDVIALAKGSNGACFEVFRYRNGRLCDQEEFLIDPVDDDVSARTEFIIRYYSLRDEVPPHVILDGEIKDMELIRRFLWEKAGRKVEVIIPQKGEQHKLVRMCYLNAAEYLAQKNGRTAKELTALEELADLLGLQSPPAYIEAYDISHHAGEDNVAGMVVFLDGRPYKKAYKRFKIKTVEGSDDYGSMREVITRRMNEYEAEKESGEGFGYLPDLILLDGGIGQVNAVLPVIREQGYEIPLFGMVKDQKHHTRAIVSQKGEVAIKATRSAFTLVSTIQEEVHRFAIGYHRKAKSKRSLSSTLTDIPGVGEGRARKLLNHFKTITAIKEADISDLQNIKGMPAAVAESIYRHFHID